MKEERTTGEILAQHNDNCERLAESYRRSVEFERRQLAFWSEPESGNPRKMRDSRKAARCRRSIKLFEARAAECLRNKVSV